MAIYGKPRLDVFSARPREDPLSPSVSPKVTRDRALLAPRAPEPRKAAPPPKIPSLLDPWAGQQKQDIPKEVIPPGLPYYAARVAGSLERGIMGMAQLPFAAEKWILGENQSEWGKKAYEALDPYEHGIITPSEQETREFRDMYYYHDGKMRGHINRAVEAGVDVAGFIIQMVATRKIPAVGRFIKGKKLGRLDKILKSGHALPKGIWSAAQAGAGVRAAAVTAIHGAISTPGTVEERARAGIMRMTYNITPTITGVMGFTGASAMTVDFLLNSLITSPQYMKMHKEAGGFNDDFWGGAFPQLAMDFAMSLSTRGLSENRLLKVDKMIWAKSGPKLKRSGITFEKFHKDMNLMRHTLNKDPAIPKNVTEAPLKVQSVVETGKVVDGKVVKADPTLIERTVTPYEEQTTEMMNFLLSKGKVNYKSRTVNDFTQIERHELIRLLEGVDKKDALGIINEYLISKENRIIGKGVGDPYDESKYMISMRGESMTLRALATKLEQEGLAMEQLEFVMGRLPGTKYPITVDHLIGGLRKSIALGGNKVPEKIDISETGKETPVMLKEDPSIKVADKLEKEVAQEAKVAKVVKEEVKVIKGEPKIKTILPKTLPENLKQVIAYLKPVFDNPLVPRVKLDWDKPYNPQARDFERTLADSKEKGFLTPNQQWFKVGDEYIIEQSSGRLAKSVFGQGARKGISIYKVASSIVKKKPILKNIMYIDGERMTTFKAKRVVSEMIKHATPPPGEMPRLKHGVVDKLEVPKGQEKMGSQGVWSVDNLDLFRRLVESRPLLSVQVKDSTKPLTKEGYRAGAGASREDGGKIWLDRDYLKVQYKKILEGESPYTKSIIWPFNGKDLTFDEFVDYNIKHERAHLSTGLDGGKIDENILNVIAFERMGRADLADVIIGTIPRTFKNISDYKQFYQGPEGVKQEGLTGLTLPKGTPAIPEAAAEVVKGIDLKDWLNERRRNTVIYRWNNRKKIYAAADSIKGLLSRTQSLQQQLKDAGMEYNEDTHQIVGLDIVKGEYFEAAVERGERTIAGQKAELWKYGTFGKGKSELEWRSPTADAKRNIWDTMRAMEAAKDSLKDSPEDSKKVEDFYQHEIDQIRIGVPFKDRPDVDKWITERKVADARMRAEKEKPTIEEATGFVPGDKLSDGETIEKDDAVAVGPDGKDAQNVGFGIKMGLAKKKWLGLFGRDQPIDERSEAVVAAILQFKQKGRFNVSTGMSAQNVVVKGVLEEIAVSMPTLSKEARDKLYYTKAAIMTRASAEITHNDGDKPDVFARTAGTGRKHAWDSIERRDKVLGEFKRLAGEVGYEITPQLAKALETHRTDLLYFSMLSPKLQGLVTWAKIQDQVLMKAQLDKGVYSEANMVSNVEKGWVRRLLTKKEHERGGGYKAAIPSTYEAGRNPELRYYDEFFLKSKANNLDPIDDFGIVIGDYVRGSYDRLDLQDTIDFLKNQTAANQPFKDRTLNLFEYAHKFNDIEKGVAGEGILSKLNYKKLHQAGMVTWTKGKYYEPWVSPDIFDIINQMHQPIKGFKHLRRVNSAVKRTVMFSPNLFAIQIASTPMVWLGAQKAWSYGIKPLVTGEIFRKGFQLGKRMRKGVLDPFEHYFTKGYDLQKLSLFRQHGLKSFDMPEVMANLFDKAQTGEAGKHPMLKSNIQNLKDALWGKNGIDRYAFNHYVAKNMYSLADMFYGRFTKKGMDSDTAARRAVALTNDLTGMLDANIYGREAAALQGLFFARDFTMSFSRQLTGALYPMFKAMGLKNLYKYKTGDTSGLFNSLFHGEKSTIDLDVLAPMYATHLAKVILWKVAIVNMFQVGLSFMNKDEDERGKFAWQNEKGRKLQIKLPDKDKWGNNQYVDVLALREATQLMDLIPGLGKGPWGLFKSKISYGVRQAVDQLTNTDYSGRPIVAGIEGVGAGTEVWERLKHAGRGAIPSPFRGDIRRPTGMLASVVAGLPIKRGRNIQKGWSNEELQRMDQALDRETFRRSQLQQKVFLASNLELMRMLHAREITGEQYRNERMKRRLPQTYRMKQNRAALRRQGFRR